MQIWVTLAVSIYRFFVPSTNTLSPNVLIETSNMKVEDYSHNSMILPLGSGHEPGWFIANFEPNLGFSGALIGLLGEAKWGIECNNSDTAKINSCVLLSNKTSEQFYGSVLVHTKPAAMHLRLSQLLKLDPTTGDSLRLPISMVVGGQPWPLDGWGVLGLSPRGDFANYYRALYSTDFELLLKFKISSFDRDQEDLEFRLMSVLNPVYPAASVIGTYPLDKNDAYWTLIGGLDMISDIWNVKSTRICMSSVAGGLILVPDPIDRCDAVRAIICNGKIGPNCIKQIADLSKAPTLNITLADTTIQLVPDLYLYAHENVLKCRFESLYRHRGSDCESTAELGVGRLFFEYFAPVLRYQADGSAAITLLANYDGPNDAPKYWALIFFYSILAVALVCGVVALVYNHSKTAHYADENHLRETLASSRL